MPSQFVWLKDIAVWLGKTYGKDVAIATKDSLAHQWAKPFKSRNILILGPGQSGKSSLVLHLQHGQPFEVKKGEVVTAEPTLLAAIVDKKFSVQKKSWLKIKTDVPGNKQLRESWKQAVEDLHPHGIIYMLDGRASEERLKESIQELGHDVFDKCYPAGPRELGAFHLFLNFADQWGGDPKVVRAKLRAVRDAMERQLDTRPLFAALRYDVAPTHLSPNATSWDMTNRAIHKFGVDILGV